MDLTKAIRAWSKIGLEIDPQRLIDHRGIISKWAGPLASTPLADDALRGIDEVEARAPEQVERIPRKRCPKCCRLRMVLSWQCNDPSCPGAWDSDHDPGIKIKEPGRQHPAQGKEGPQDGITARPLTIPDTPKSPAPQHQPSSMKGNPEMNWNDAFPKKYVRAQDLRDRTVVTIDTVIEGEKIGTDLKPVAYFRGDKVKPLVLNATNCATLEEINGSADMSDWGGTEVVLYPTKVRFQGKLTPAIRIDHPPKRKENLDDDINL